MSQQVTDGDLEDLQQAFDADGDGKVSWEEALDTFSVKLKSMASDKRDLWVRLLDYHIYVR